MQSILDFKGDKHQEFSKVLLVELLTALEITYHWVSIRYGCTIDQFDTHLESLKDTPLRVLVLSGISTADQSLVDHLVALKELEGFPDTTIVRFW